MEDNNKFKININYNTNLKSSLTCRTIKCLNDLNLVSEENILVVDSGCDQSIVTNLGFNIGCRTGVYF